MFSKHLGLVVGASVILATALSAVPAMGAGYTLQSAPFPEAWANDVTLMVRDFAPGGYSFYEFDAKAFILSKDGEPAEGLADLGLADAVAVAEEASLDGLGRGMEEVDGRKAYAALRDFVLEYSPCEMARLRNFRTVMRLFQIKDDADLARWQAWHGRTGSPFVGFTDCFLLRRRNESTAFYVMFGCVDMD